MGLWTTIFLLGVLSSCSQSDAEDSGPAHEVPEARFLSPWLPGGGMGLYLVTTGEPKSIQENIRNFAPIEQGQFARNQIPAHAIAAGRFLEVGDSMEDFQAVFVVQEEGQLRVYRGYFIPGFGGPLEWERVRF